LDDCIVLPENIHYFRAVVNKVMNSSHPYNSGKSLTRQGKLASREGISYEGGMNEENACSKVSYLLSTKGY
jgi:hypothetical protein